MSANKRAGDSSTYSGPNKVQRNQVKKSDFIQQALSMSTMITDENNSNGNALGPVEVMETPFKSENDKKSYRVIRLSNGLIALLITDPTQELESHEQEHVNVSDGKQHEAVTTSGDHEEDEDEDGKDAEDESSDDDEHSDDDGENVRGQQKRGKLAACCLCVDVGSFSDPRDVQGLAHFLGKNTQICTSWLSLFGL